MRRAVGIAATVVMVLGVAQTHRAKGPIRSRATLRPAGGARYSIVSPPPLETIHLWDGALDLEVEPLRVGERFRVEVGDGAVEVRGTKFEVVASADRLLRVTVTRGRVEIRPNGADAVTLGAGQAWSPATRAPKVASSFSTAPASVPQAHCSHATRRRRLAASTMMSLERVPRFTEQEARYDDAWDALRARDFKKAAGGFSRVLAVSPEGPLAAEAAFWRATSLARGGDPGDAIAAFRDLLATYPECPRRGEASTILGWLLVDAHQPTEASARFRAAVDDPHESVQASAREGLEALRAAAASSVLRRAP